MKKGTIYVYSGDTVTLPKYVNVTKIGKGIHTNCLGRDLDCLLIEYSKEMQKDLLDAIMHNKSVHNWNLTKWEWGE